MPTNLTDARINDSYPQLLHVDGGVSASEKTVYSGVGTATALSVSIGSVSAGDVKFSGNTVTARTANGDLNILPNGTGSVNLSGVAISSGSISGITDLAIADGGTGASTASDARVNLGLGTLSTQNSDNISITGGNITNVVFTGSFSGITEIESDTFKTFNGGDGLDITDNVITSDGPSTNIDIELTPKGTGSVVVSKIAVTSGTIPFNTITNRAYASFYDAGTTDQTGSTTDRTAVKWATAAVTGAGITVASNSRITLAAAGTYRFNISIQLANSDSSARDTTFWFAKNGTDIASSATQVSVPKAADGGKALFAIEIFDTVAANDYIEAYWYTTSANVTLHYVAPVVASPGVTPAIPAIPPAIVVVERVA